MIDVIDLARTYLPIVVAFVLAISFLLLLLAFRSIVVPLKAIVMNLLSVFASYGLLVLVFQQGDRCATVRVPAGRADRSLGAAVPVLHPVRPLDGLPRLPAQPHQGAVRPTGDNEQAVAAGLRMHRPLITGAALIMVGVFGGFAAGDLANLQQFGFGLAAAVFLDATLVRMILVPASMALLGQPQLVPADLAGAGCRRCTSRARPRPARLRRRHATHATPRSNRHWPTKHSPGQPASNRRPPRSPVGRAFDV